MLLVKGADVNAKTNTGDTALILASEQGYRETAQALIEKRADVNAKRIDGTTALIFASEKGNRDVVQVLIDTGADVKPSLRVFFSRFYGAINCTIVPNVRWHRVVHSASYGFTRTALSMVCSQVDYVVGESPKRPFVHESAEEAKVRRCQSRSLSSAP